MRLFKKTKKEKPDLEAPSPQEKVEKEKEVKEQPKTVENLKKEQKQIEAQQLILDQQEALMNPGVYRLNNLNQVIKINHTLIEANKVQVELGQKMLTAMKRIATALESLEKE